MSKAPSPLSPPLLERQIAAAPHEPGCYQFRNAAAKVLYVGKAIDLHKRVRAYLRPDNDSRAHIAILMRQVVSVDFIVVSNEKEALVLENNLIKRLRPRYNIQLARDDRTYVSVRVDIRHEYPRARVVHKYRRDGAIYIGPFASSSKLYKTLEALKRSFPLRLCTDHVLANRTRACVYHEIGICCAPCVPGTISPQDYGEIVKGFLAMLKGRDSGVVKNLEQEMEQLSSDLKFERAAELRDRIDAIRETIVQQRAQIGEGRGRAADRDIIGYYREADCASLTVLMYRDGKLEETTSHEIKSLLPDEEILAAFLEQYYERAAFIPDEIVIGQALDGLGALSSWLSDKAERAIKVVHPQRGEKIKLLQMAAVNARHALRVRSESEDRDRDLLQDLQEAAGLEKTPLRMECYDISHTSGKETVASGVCFVDGRASKKDYRHYRIRSHDRNDDFASMEEVLRRRLERGRIERNFPDLIVIDGGPGQLGRVQKVFDELNVIGIDLISLAKSRVRKGRSRSGEIVRTDERIFVPGRDEPITLDQRSPALYLLMRIRDEAHRFAINYHRKLRRKEALKSGLDAIAGVGPKKKKALIRKFGSPKYVKLASVNNLEAVPGVNRALAEKIHLHFTAEREVILNRERDKP